MLRWSSFQVMLIADFAVSLIVFLMLMPLLNDQGLRFVVGLAVLAMSIFAAIVMRRMTGY